MDSSDGSCGLEGAMESKRSRMSLSTRAMTPASVEATCLKMREFLSRHVQ